MLKAAFNEFKYYADLLKKQEGIDYSTPGKEVVEVMANGYCEAKDAGDDQKKNLYIAGLMLRFWYRIGKLKAASPIQGLDYIDFMTWVYEAIEYACKYRAWQNPTKGVNAQQAINQCIETIRMQKYYDLNLQKNKANVNTYSLDAPVEDEGRATVLDTLIDETSLDHYRTVQGTLAARDLIQTCINKKQIVEAIILDTIAFNDVQKITKYVDKGVDEDGNAYKHTRHVSEFWPFKCVQALGQLPTDYAKYFITNYRVVEKELEAALNVIKKANNQKLYRFLEKTLSSTKQLVEVF